MERITRAGLVKFETGIISDKKTGSFQPARRSRGRGRPNNGTRRWPSRKPNFVSANDDFTNISFLKKLTDHNESDTILSFLSKNNEKYSQIFTYSLEHSLLVPITKLNVKLCQSTFVADKYKVLHITMNEHFVKGWNEIISTTVLDRQNPSLKWKNLETDLLNIFTIFEHSLDLMPSMCWYMIKGTLKLIKINEGVINNEGTSSFSMDFQKRFLRLTEKVDFFENRYSKKNSRTKISFNKELAPQDDYRSITIFPSIKELVTPERNFTRKNITKGSYENIAHYLDVLFRLQREDFLNPIREDVCDYISEVDRHLFNIKVFDNVTFFGQTVNKDDICFTLQLNMDKKTETRLKAHQSKRFMTGSLLLFTDDDFKTIFCGLVTKSEAASRGELTVSFEDTFPKLKHGYKMIECIVFFDPYYHALKVLQTIPHDQLPMSKYIVDVSTSINRPKYLPLRVSGPSDLNESQRKALKGALTQEFVVIQGPPGTGKTFLGLKITRELLMHSPGPILVICYTNHALDQFLEGLLSATEKLVRLGSQSKSKVLLEQHSLRNRRREENIRVMVQEERQMIERAAAGIAATDKLIKKLRDHSGVIHFGLIFANVKFLQDSCFSYFTEEDFFIWMLQDTSKPDGGLEEIEYIREIYWNYLKTSKNKKEYFLSPLEMGNWLISIKHQMYSLRLEIESVNAAFADGELSEGVYGEYMEFYDMNLKFIRIDHQVITEKLHFLTEHLNKKYDPPTKEIINNPLILPSDKRWELYYYWLGLTEELLQAEKLQQIMLYRQAYTEFDSLMEDANVATMRKMDIIGMTTSCAARMHKVLQRVACPIVVVEEAAEVVEAHIVTALTKDCQHLILLGDHQQLKPSTSDYVIEKQFNLGVSLFERMVKNNIQCHTLNVQHRMRPEIASLVSPAIYPDLQNHESVQKYPEVRGVKRSLFFIDHDHREEPFGDSSKLNKFEARYLVKLAEYFLRIGYTSEEVTILAAYSGQVVTVQKELAKIKFKGSEKIHVTAVDNFQGEESKIILLSLVRNNDYGNVGFLSIENRICVALSRAKEGMYVMGNMKQLCGASKIWQKINETLTSHNGIGNSLPLICQIHETVTDIKEVEDFEKVPEGGCDKDCDSLLQCGHTCKRKCHVVDLFHDEYRCHERCLKQICKDTSHALCKKFCYQNCGKCCHPVTVALSCGHDQNVECHNQKKLDGVLCIFKEKIDLGCGHAVEKFCHEKSPKCEKLCNVMLECGHKCVQKCHYNKDPQHKNYKCQIPCKKENLRCNKLAKKHFSTVPCSESATICTVKSMKFRKECSHVYNDVECHRDVDNVTCPKPCKKSLPCKHQCPNKCSETCGPCKKEVPKEAPCGHWLNTICGKTSTTTNCTKQCKKVLPCGHTCPNKCGEVCSKKCTSTCNKKLDCGHFCIANCGERCACEIKRIPECLHKVMLKCNQEPLKELCNKCLLVLDSDDDSDDISEYDFSGVSVYQMMISWIFITHQIIRRRRSNTYCGLVSASFHWLLRLCDTPLIFLLNCK